MRREEAASRWTPHGRRDMVDLLLLLSALHTMFSHCGCMSLSALSLWPGCQPYRPRLLGGRRGRTIPVRSRLIARQQSQSSPDPAGKDSATSCPVLMEDGTSVRLYFQSCSLLLFANEPSGVTVRMKLFRDFNLLATGW